MNELSLFNFGPHEVREMEKNGEPWFVAKDAIQVLDLGNITEALRGLKEDELSSVVLKSDTQNREFKIISEPGLYRLIFKSRKPEAEAFKRWVTHEVLPSIRKFIARKLGRDSWPELCAEALAEKKEVV